LHRGELVPTASGEAVLSAPSCHQSAGLEASNRRQRSTITQAPRQGSRMRIPENRPQQPCF
jgi:hypothetical protein